MKYKVVTEAAISDELVAIDPVTYFFYLHRVIVVL
jgi:hypothetical protein